LIVQYRYAGEIVLGVEGLVSSERDGGVREGDQKWICGVLLVTLDEIA
jgi:hypothetical protein